VTVARATACRDGRARAAALPVGAGLPSRQCKTSIWQTVVTLLENALFKAILPGLKHQLGRD
jgi:hypothetical protein